MTKKKKKKKKKKKIDEELNNFFGTITQNIDEKNDKI